MHIAYLLFIMPSLSVSVTLPDFNAMSLKKLICLPIEVPARYFKTRIFLCFYSFTYGIVVLVESFSFVL